MSLSDFGLTVDTGNFLLERAKTLPTLILEPLALKF